MGRRRTANGLENDVKYSRRIYCYLANNPSIVGFAKRSMNKRERRAGKAEAKREAESHLILGED